MDKIQVLNDSRMARLVYDTFRDLIQKHRNDLLNRLLSETKLGAVDPQIYAKHLGGIAALDEFDSAVRKQVLKGEKIERELLYAARNTEDRRY